MNCTVIKLFVAVLCICSVAVISSCEKQKETIATILVLTEDGDPVPGAWVRIFSNPTPPPSPNELRFNDSAQTNGSGKVTFNFTDFYKKGQAGFAVLDLEGWKGSLYGTGIIKIEEEVTTEETLEIE
ncbi:MAG: hypothetical protein SH856_10095 [Flavobacteriales bacterium]|nr:hypothetical protein [Flavobacteriales bacterium]